MTIRYTSPNVRRAVISRVDYNSGVAYTRWLDDDSDGPRIPIPHPFGNKGGSGIFVGIKIGTIVVLSPSSYKDYVPLAVLPVNAYYNSDDSAIPEADFDDLGFPYIGPGDVIVRGPTGSELSLNSSIEEVILSNEFDEGFKIGGGDNSFRCSLQTMSPTNYIISQHGIRASGVVRRDVKSEDVEESFVDYLTDLESEQSLEEIGWNPNKQVTYTNCVSISGNTGSNLYRNPAFVEDRQVVYEFGRDWFVGSFEEEDARVDSQSVPIPDSSNRSERRNNALSLSLTNPNELIETISGTVVDIFGNLLDINRRIIEIPNGNSSRETFEDTVEKVRHTIAYHMEINARKGIRFDSKSKPRLFKSPLSESIESVSNSARDRSRWSIDIDKEGLTKINIPASSETGNIPIITRYENSSVLDIDVDGSKTTKSRSTVGDTKKIYHNQQNRDIFTEQVGPGGIKITSNIPDNRMSGKRTNWVESDSDGVVSGEVSQTIMGQTLEAGTAFHEITRTALALIRENINKSASDIFPNGTTSDDPGLRAISQEVNNTVPRANTSVATRSSDKSGILDNQPNAGGRSIHANLDGSLEMSIGANTIDRVSWILDTAGALVCRLGRDRSGRSAIIHTDGTVALEVGGFDYVGTSSDDEVDTRFVGRGEPRAQILELDPHQFKSGKVIIKVRRSKRDSSGPEQDDALVVIDETGLTITTPGRLDIISGQDMSFNSKSRIILDAPKVQVYRDSPKYLSRTSRRIS